MINGSIEGAELCGGTIVDATIIAAPGSTKNLNGERDPQMRQDRKGSQYCLRMKDEVAGLLVQLHGRHGLMASLLQGTGMRLMECVCLLIEDVISRGARSPCAMAGAAGIVARRCRCPCATRCWRSWSGRAECTHDVAAGSGKGCEHSMGGEGIRTGEGRLSPMTAATPMRRPRPSSNASAVQHRLVAHRTLVGAGRQ
ncbi:hypothetical protein Y886_23145 [Xanthomonas hyacinthi DSM 19077]|nr:hypothetical protein Y886_23145 [Xanthomonas hyacinthi DSM 19077]